jgi:hypothetical protein
MNDPKGEIGKTKPPMWLLPSVALTEAAWAHNNGAEKYSVNIPVNEFDIELQLAKFCTCGLYISNPLAIQKDDTKRGACVGNVIEQVGHQPRKQNATQSESCGQKGCVKTATINISNQSIQNTKPSSIKTAMIGHHPTKKGSKNIIKATTNSRTLKNANETIAGSAYCQDSDLIAKTSNKSCSSKITNAPFAEGRREDTKDSASTIATKQTFSVDSCATDATRGLDLSGILAGILKMHLPTCGAQKMTIRNSSLYKTGAYNWRSAKVCASTYISAMMRHWAAYLDGEDRAEDSKCHHLAHIVANCNILMDAAKCGTLVDDRPKMPNGQV